MYHRQDPVFVLWQIAAEIADAVEYTVVRIVEVGGFAALLKAVRERRRMSSPSMRYAMY